MVWRPWNLARRGIAARPGVAAWAAVWALLGACGDDASPDAAPRIDALPMQSITLSHDDGTVDEPFSLFGSSPGAQVAVRFTPPGHPAYVDAVEIFVADGFGVPTTPFRVRVYSESPQTGLPDRVLLGHAVDVAATAGGTWVAVDLTDQGAMVEEGEIFVAMEWLTAPGASGENAQFIGADLSSPDQRSYYTLAGTIDWGRIIRFTGGHDLDFMIRATVSYPISR